MTCASCKNYIPYGKFILISERDQSGDPDYSRSDEDYTFCGWLCVNNFARDHNGED